MTGEITVKTDLFPSKGECLIHFVFEDLLTKDKNLNKLDSIIGGLIGKKVSKHIFKANARQTLALPGGSLYEHILLVGCGKVAEFTPSDFKNALAQGIRTASHLKVRSMNLLFDSGLAENPFEFGKSVSIALHLANYRFDRYKSKKDIESHQKLEHIQILFEKSVPPDIRKGIEVGKIISEGIYLVRDLVNEPSSAVKPQQLADQAQIIAGKSKGTIHAEVLERAECKKMGMNAYLGVAQGSDVEPKFIVLRYTGAQGTAKNRRKKLCIVGKSITFDSGGLSLKPSESMEEMKTDMAGGATVLGIFHILGEMIRKGYAPHIRYDVVGVLPACENMPSGKAMCPGDVVRALNGKTIEVLNTDAEGRLALADALVYAEKYIKPDQIIDLATLTGACMVALGNDLAGLFGSSDAFTRAFLAVAKRQGDEAWHMPLFHTYRKHLKSEIADLRNISKVRYGGAITAALFLSEFVETKDWIHVDIAGPAYHNGRPYGLLPHGGTGWGVQTLMSFITNL